MAPPGAGKTNQHISKDTKRGALILPMTVLLHRSLTLGTNYSGDNLLAKDLSGARPEHTPRALTCQVRPSRTVDPRHFPGKNFADVVSLPNYEAQTYLISIFAVAPWMYSTERQSRRHILGGAERVPKRDGKS